MLKVGFSSNSKALFTIEMKRQNALIKDLQLLASLLLVLNLINLTKASNAFCTPLFIRYINVNHFSSKIPQESFSLVKQHNLCVDNIKKIYKYICRNQHCEFSFSNIKMDFYQVMATTLRNMC